MSFPLTVSTDNDQDMLDVLGSGGDLGSDRIQKKHNFILDFHLYLCLGHNSKSNTFISSDYRLKKKKNFFLNWFFFLLFIGFVFSSGFFQSWSFLSVVQFVEHG